MKLWPKAGSMPNVVCRVLRFRNNHIKAPGCPVLLCPRLQGKPFVWLRGRAESVHEQAHRDTAGRVLKDAWILDAVAVIVLCVRYRRCTAHGLEPSPGLSGAGEVAGR